MIRVGQVGDHAVPHRVGRVIDRLFTGGGRAVFHDRDSQTLEFRKLNEIQTAFEKLRPGIGDTATDQDDVVLLHQRGRVLARAVQVNSLVQRIQTQNALRQLELARITQTLCGEKLLEKAQIRIPGLLW